MFRFLSRPSSKSAAPVRQARPSLERCESRDLLSAGPVYQAAARQVVIAGTVASDTTTVSTTSTLVVVRFNGKVKAFNRAAVDRVLFSGNAGNDTFVNNTGLRSIVNGGVGDDRLTGGSGDDWLDGGSGNDDVLGRTGDDRLLGSSGDDSLDGGLGSDDVFGGLGDDRANRGRNDRVSGCERFELHATLTGVSGASGEAEFKPGTKVNRNFEAEVFGLAANQAYDVVVNGTVLGTLQTNSAGHGELKLTDASLSIPDGATIAIRSGGTDVLTGKFSNTQGGDDGGDDDDGDDDNGGGGGGNNGGSGKDRTKVEYKAVLTGTSGATGESEFKLGQRIKRNFEAEVFGLQPGTRFDVVIGTAVIGQLRIGALGHGELKLNNPNLPIQAGTVIAIRGLDGTTVLSGTFRRVS